MSIYTSWYWAALTAAGSVPADVHRRAWADSVARSDINSQANLIRRLDAPADLVSVYARCTDVTLRNAYLSRADVSDETEYTGKVTASALAEALVSSKWSAPVYAAALAHFENKTTKVLADVLVQTPDRLRHGALSEALFRFADTQRSGKAPDQWADLLEPHAGHLTGDQAAALLADLGSARIVSVLLRLDVDTSDVLDACRRVGAPLAKFVATNVANARHGVSILLAIFRDSALVHGRNQATVNAALTGTLTVAQSDYALSIAATARPPWRTQLPLAMKDAAAWERDREAFTDIATAPVARLAEWAHSSRVEDLVEVVSRVENLVADAVEEHHRGNLPDVPAEAAAALWENVNAPAALRHRLVHAWQTLPPDMRGTMRIDSLAVWPDDVVLRDAWCDLWPGDVLASYGWSPFEASAPRKEWLTRWAQSCTDSPTHAHAERALRVAAATLTGTELRHLPWRILRSIQHNTDSRAAVKVAICLSDTFADTPAAWRVFEQLAGNFDGTFGDLLDVCLVATR